MSDSPVRPGPPIPAHMTPESSGPAPEATLESRPGPELADLTRIAPAERKPAATRRPTARPRRASRSSDLRPQRRAAPLVSAWVPGLLVAVLVVASLWGSRGLHEPVAGFGLISASGTMRPAGSGSEVATGQAAPDFRLLSVGDDVVELSDLRGAPVVLLFWNTWCLDCQPMLPVMQQAATDWGDGVAVVGVVPQEGAGRVQTAASSQGLTFRQVLDDLGDVTSAYGASVGPVTVVLNADGVVTTVLNGPVTLADLHAAVSPLLP